MYRSIRTSARHITSLVLVTLLGFGSASAGIVVTTGDGIAMTGADGIAMTGADGIAMTGADGFLSFGVNGIAMTGADGIAMTGADGIAMTGADGIAMTGADGIAMTGADGIAMTGADGIAMTGADGIAMTGADGTRYHADSLVAIRPNGIAMTGVDSATAYGVNGIAMTGADGIAMTGADGIAMTGADGIAMTGADAVVAKAPDGRTFSLPANGLSVTGADTVTVTAANDIRVTGADSIRRTGPGATAAAAAAPDAGLRSVDPELAVTLDRMSDDSTINAVVVFHRHPTAQDLADLQRVGVIGGTRFRALPLIYVTGTRDQLVEISRLSSVRSIYGNRTLQLTDDPARGATGVERARRDADITRHNAGLPVSGRGVTVAVLDTGVDATHADFAGRVAQNVKLADAQTAGAGFAYPASVEGLPNTDQAHGHGTLVAGVIGGSGARSGGQYAGVAPGARLVGLSAGDLSLLHVLGGFDYLLSQGAQMGVRVVNCSFSAAAVYDANDPVNVATKMLADRGVNVVFSAGNAGPGLHTLNPYAAAPWVVSVGAMEGGRVASFSSRGSFGSNQFRPTLVAPGVRVVGPRAAGVNVTGTEGVGFNHDVGLAPAHVPFYTQATGTSFSAPQVAGAIALMLEANPRLTPAEVREILQRTATPLAPYYAHEVGAGMLNTHAAVLAAAFSSRLLGHFRARAGNHYVRYIAEPLHTFTGTVAPGASGYETTIDVPEGTLLASVQIGWGPLWSLNDLGLALSDPGGIRRADVNTLNLPGLSGRRERALLSRPAAGAWRVAVRNTLGLAGTPQEVTGVLEIMRAEYPQMSDTSALTAAQREAVLQSLRTQALAPIGRNFRPAASVTRSELAAALVVGGRVPQYMPGTPTFRDVRDQMTMLAVESCQHSPRGALFHGTDAGGAFSPHAPADRLTAAVALVRAAGLQAEAEAKNDDLLLHLTDAASVPASLRGYVSVAVARGLLAPDQSAFRPQTALTRLDLARATAALQELLAR